MDRTTILVLSITFGIMVAVYITAKILVYLENRRLESQWIRGDLIREAMTTGRSLSAPDSVFPSVSMSEPVRWSSPSESPSTTESPSPTATESISPSGDYYVDPYPGTQIYVQDVSMFSDSPNQAVFHHRIEDEIIIRRDRDGRQYIVGTRRKKEEDNSVFSPSPKDRPARKLDE